MHHLPYEKHPWINIWYTNVSVRPISLSKWFQLKNIQQNFEKHFPTHNTKVVALWKEQTSKFLKVHGLNFIVFPNIELSHRNLYIHIFYAWLQLVPQVFEIAVNKHFICKVNTKGGGEKIIYIIFAIVIDTRIYQTDVNLTNCQKKYQLCGINYKVDTLWKHILA